MSGHFDIIKKTKDLWHSRTGIRPTDEEAREIVDNVAEFFRILSEWQSKEQEKHDESN